MLTRLTIATLILIAGIWFSCKSRDTSRTTSDGDNGPACPLDDSWAGRMGMKLSNGGNGAVIDCVEIGEGLHHIGLRVGDKITALNFDTPVASAAAFEQVATELAKDTAKRIARWEFTVERSGQTVAVAPSAEYPGCGVFTFDDCGPLGQ